MRQPLKEGRDCHQQRRESMAGPLRPEHLPANALQGPAGCARRLAWESRGAGSWHRRRPQGRVHGAGLGPRRAAPRRRGARAGAVRQVPGSLRGAAPATTPRLCGDTLSRSCGSRVLVPRGPVPRPKATAAQWAAPVGTRLEVLVCHVALFLSGVGRSPRRVSSARTAGWGTASALGPGAASPWDWVHLQDPQPPSCLLSHRRKGAEYQWLVCFLLKHRGLRMGLIIRISRRTPRGGSVCHHPHPLLSQAGRRPGHVTTAGPLPHSSGLGAGMGARRASGGARTLRERRGPPLSFQGREIYF